MKYIQYLFNVVIYCVQDMNLIEVLWKQDVDMGFTMSTYQDLGKPEECPTKVVQKHDTSTGSSTNEALDEKVCVLSFIYKI